MLRIVVVLSIFTICADAACTLKVDKEQPGLFIKQFGSNHIIMSTHHDSLEIEDDTAIEAFCRKGFRGVPDYETQINFTCYGDTIYFSVPASTKDDQYYNINNLGCPGEASYYEANVTTCKHYGLQFGFFIGSKPVMIASICYNLNTMRTKFIHYVAATRSNILGNQPNFNPGNASIDINSLVSVIFDHTFIPLIEKENASVMRAVKESMPYYADIVEYQLLPLVPISIAGGYLQNYMKSFDVINIAAWWKPLKFGNWREVENAIAKAAIDGVYDVYVGASGSVACPYDGKCFIHEPVLYNFDQTTRAIPLYIWTYITVKNHLDNGVVIVGINSPFLQAPKTNETEFCADQCGNFGFLKTLSKVRQMSALGYIYCCKLEDVKFKLDGFPEF